METALFWIAWGVISYWSLKTFYSSFSKEKLNRLRKAAFGIHLSILILSFLPWLPPTLGGKNGLALALEGDILAVLFFVFTIISVVLLQTKSPSNFKIAACATIVNTFILFILMMQIRPESFTFSLFDIAPVIAVLLLLVGDVAVLLLWQQLQLIKKK